MKNNTAYQFRVKEFKMDAMILPAHVRSNLSAVMILIKKYDWNIIAFYGPTYHIVLKHKTKSQQMNIYLTTLTVQTSMNHPKKGKTQMNRKGLDIYGVERLFKNIRSHTGKGYYTKSK